ncbi:MAG: hypothetical protein HY272_05890 [Gammaproteobacteria bacterium]|nr:hypothetical protein [Gammaproteobacteria bacterium]
MPNSKPVSELNNLYERESRLSVLVTQEGKQRSTSSSITIRLADTFEYLQAAYTLVHDKYVKQGYQAPSPSGVRFLPHFGLPTSHTVVAEIGGKIVGTLTIVTDGLLGLPLEKEYPAAIKALRSRKGHLAEICCLATRGGGPLELPVLLQLMYASYDLCLRQLGVTDLCVAVTTGHQSFYRKILQFESIGETTQYSSCNNVAAVAMQLNLQQAWDRFHGAHNINRMVGRFFLEKAPLEDTGLILPQEANVMVRRQFAVEHIDWAQLNEIERKRIEIALAHHSVFH